ncbi:hypothetical protein FQR65_LT09533 [Abscondita terminalis]|nr:hypothetical protein FQR65_LT09533 [Abscondita terminalis]
MANVIDILSNTPSDLVNNQLPNEKKKKCGCGNFAKSGVQCVVCFNWYHNGCIQRVQSCCKMPLVPSTPLSPTPLPTSDSTSVSDIIEKYDLMKELVSEQRLTNKLLLEKISFLEIENAMLKSKMNCNCQIGNPTYARDNTAANKIENKLIDETQPKWPMLTTSNIVDTQQQKQPTQTANHQIATSNVSKGAIPKRTLNVAMSQISQNEKSNAKQRSQYSERTTTDVNAINALTNKDNWTTVSYRKKKNVIKGTAEWDSDNFCAAKPKAWIYVGRGKKDATIETINTYLSNRLPKHTFEVEQINSAAARYSAFKVGADFSLRDELLKPELWPRGKLLKRILSDEAYQLLPTVSSEAAPTTNAMLTADDQPPTPKLSTITKSHSPNRNTTIISPLTRHNPPSRAAPGHFIFIIYWLTYAQ